MSKDNHRFSPNLFNSKPKQKTSFKLNAGLSLMNGHKNLSLEVHNANTEVVFLETC